MKLSFLGRSYDASLTDIETPQGANTARFLGKTYNPRTPLKVSAAPQLQRRYRGVTY